MIKVNFYHIDSKMVILIPLKKDYIFKFISYTNKYKRISVRKILCKIKMNKQDIIHRNSYIFMKGLKYLGSISIPKEIFIGSLNIKNGFENSEYVETMSIILSDLDNYV